MNLYIIRSKPHNHNREDEFLNGRISIGWPCDHDLKLKNRVDLEIILKKKYSDLSQINISQVEQFINIPENSIVITPSIKNKSQVHIFKTISTYKYDSSKDNGKIGNPHFIDVELIKTIQKLELPEDIKKSVSGARKTVSNISKHSEIMDFFLKKGNNNLNHKDNSNNKQREKGLKVLEELLNSDNEEIKLKASIELLRQLK